jgi:hypothetical protein
MVGTVLHNGPANGKRTQVFMKMLTMQTMGDRLHLILSDRSECTGSS